MKEFICGSVYFGVGISLLGYAAGTALKKKFKTGLINPLLVSIVLVIGVLLILGIDYDSYYEGAKYLSYLLTPTTVCLAVPLYRQLDMLKKNAWAVGIGIFAGALASVVSVLLLSWVFGLDHQQYVTLLPKSITTAIGMGVSEELGGISTITVAVIIITGIIGNLIASGVCKLFKIVHPVAMGIAIGTSSHAIGTTRAMELGQVQGAMSSLSIMVTGLVTVVLAPIFAGFM